MHKERQTRTETVSIALTPAEKTAIVLMARVWGTDVSNALRSRSVDEIIAAHDDTVAQMQAAQRVAA